MNYKSQLKSWAIDRVIEAKRAGFATGSNLDELQNAATILADFAYIPREDFESTAKDLFELVRNAPPGKSSIDALIGTLTHIQEDRIRQGIDGLPEETKPETVQ